MHYFSKAPPILELIKHYFCNSRQCETLLLKVTCLDSLAQKPLGHQRMTFPARLRLALWLLLICKAKGVQQAEFSITAALLNVMQWQKVKNEINAFLFSYTVSTWMIDRFRFRPILWLKAGQQSWPCSPFVHWGHFEWMLL